MKNQNKRRRLRTVFTWILWVLALQFVLVNISAALYADKFTHLKMPATEPDRNPASSNIFTKTWNLFIGPTQYKHPLTNHPAFSYSVVELKTKNNIGIEAWLGKPDSISKGTVILFHGLTGNKGMVLGEANAFRSFGYNVMLVDLRNHGNSGSAITTIGYKEAEEIELAFEYTRYTGEKNIFLWGASAGAVAIIKAVGEYNLNPAGIIIEMPFLSLQSHLEGRARFLGFPRQPFGFLTSFWIGLEQGFNGLGFKCTHYTDKINCPVLMQYGEKDELVLPYETKKIFESIAAPDKKLVYYDQAAHESFLQRDPAVWTKEVTGFLEKETKSIF